MPGEWSYRLDGDGRIAEVGPGWDEFALENDAPAARADAVRGRPLNDFIADRQTRELVRVLLHSLREADRAIEVPFRCDGPRVRRSMMWSGVGTEDGGVWIRTRLISSAVRPPVAFLEPTAARVGSPLRMCSWCNRVRATPDRWIEAHDAATELGLFMEEPTPDLTHGICPDCAATVEAMAAPAGRGAG